MSRHLKSTLVALVGYVVVTAVYIVTLMSRADGQPVEDVDYQGLVIGLIVAFVAIAIVGNAIIATRHLDENDAVDERDRLIELRGERIGGWVLAAGAIGALVLAMTDQATFWIAQAILAGLVVGEMTSSVSQLVLGRHAD
jgi:hypothetical protein